MKFIFCKLLFIIIFFIPVKGNCQQNPQGFFSYEDQYEILSLVFHRPTEALKWIRINEDISTNFISGLNATKVWEGSPIAPVAYVSGSKAKISALFKIKCQDQNAKFFASATGTEGFNFEEVELIALGNDEFSFAPIECIKSFVPLIVKFFENFELDWVIIKKDQSGQEIGRVNIGKTSNKLYVTWGYPILGLNSSFDPKSETFVHHSTIHLSC